MAQYNYPGYSPYQYGNAYGAIGSASGPGGGYAPSPPQGGNPSSAWYGHGDPYGGAGGYGGGLGFYSTNASILQVVPEEMVYMIPDHWFSFPPVNPLWRLLIALYTTLMGVIAFIGNSLVIYLFLVDKSLRSPSNMLTVNLAVSDWLMTVTNFWPTAIVGFAERWILGEIGCLLYGFFGGLTGNVSIFTLVHITRDRYNVIVRGMSATRLTYKSAILQICFIWFQCTLCAIPPFLGWNRYVLEGTFTTCTFDYLSQEPWSSKFYIMMYGSWAYMTPLLSIIYHYSSIIHTVFTHERALRDQAKKMNVASLRANSEEKSHSREVQIAKISLTTIFLWFLGWTPYALLAMSGSLNPSGVPSSYITPLNSSWGSIFSKASATYNPIVYALSHPRYRIALVTNFPCLGCPTGSDEERGGSTKGTGRRVGPSTVCDPDEDADEITVKFTKSDNDSNAERF